MRFIFGMIIGALLTIGGAYVADSRVDPLQGGRMVNWTVVGEKVDELTADLGDSGTTSRGSLPGRPRSADRPSAARSIPEIAPAAASAPARSASLPAWLGSWAVADPSTLAVPSALAALWLPSVGARSLRRRRRHHVDPGHEGHATTDDGDNGENQQRLPQACPLRRLHRHGSVDVCEERAQQRGNGAAAEEQHRGREFRLDRRLRRPRQNRKHDERRSAVQENQKARARAANRFRSLSTKIGSSRGSTRRLSFGGILVIIPPLAAAL